mmetsp:Transcript_5599/g.10857  ORF Transcript_5599/g.10857 Transcript_5599/m.10857 type:complete len:262 (-) Transcript_5599:508-1293(-)
MVATVSNSYPMSRTRDRMYAPPPHLTETPNRGSSRLALSACIDGTSISVKGLFLKLPFFLLVFLLRRFLFFLAFAEAFVFFALTFVFRNVVFCTVLFGGLGSSGGGCSSSCHFGSLSSSRFDSLHSIPILGPIHHARTNHALLHLRPNLHLVYLHLPLWNLYFCRGLARIILSCDLVQPLSVDANGAVQWRDLLDLAGEFGKDLCFHGVNVRDVIPCRGLDHLALGVEGVRFVSQLGDGGVVLRPFQIGLKGCGTLAHAQY